MENWIEETINRFQELLTHEEALEWAESLVWTLEQNSFYVMEETIISPTSLMDIIQK